MPLKYGDDGPQVVDLQEKLMALGYPLIKYGADGDLGLETLRMFNVFMRDHGAEADTEPNIIDDHEIALLFEVHAKLEVLPSFIIDRRQHSLRAIDRGPRGGRDDNSWLLTTGVMLHQTACDMGVLFDRYNAIGAHFAILRTEPAVALWMHDLNRYVVHGHGGNNQCIGFEFNGYFEGVQGVFKTLWQPPKRSEYRPVAMRPTQSQLEVGCQLVEFCERRIAAHGGKLKAILPHRVASDDRESDPGSETWQGVGIVMRDKLKLTDGDEGFIFPSSDGNPIPRQWDPRYQKHSYRGL